MIFRINSTTTNNSSSNMLEVAEAMFDLVRTHGRQQSYQRGTVFQGCPLPTPPQTLIAMI